MDNILPHSSAGKGAGLCTKCEAIKLDDSNLGVRGIQLRVNLYSLFRMTFWAIKWTMSTMIRCLSFLDLRSLLRRAATGCEFCGFLRECLLLAKLNVEGVVHVNLHYVIGRPDSSDRPPGLHGKDWDKYKKEQARLCGLKVIVKVSNITNV